jgi:hypothetical protein
MKGRRFDDIDEVQADEVRKMRAVTESDYQRGFRQWQEHWNKCIQAQGHYFKGDKTNWPVSVLFHSQKNQSRN